MSVKRNVLICGDLEPFLVYIWWETTTTPSGLYMRTYPSSLSFSTPMDNRPPRRTNIVLTFIVLFETPTFPHHKRSMNHKLRPEPSGVAGFFHFRVTIYDPDCGSPRPRIRVGIGLFGVPEIKKPELERREKLRSYPAISFSCCHDHMVLYMSVNEPPVPLVGCCVR